MKGLSSEQCSCRCSSQSFKGLRLHRVRLSCSWSSQSGWLACASASDVYSLGIVVYELACGRSPFDARTPTDYCLAHLSHEPLHLGVALPGAPEPLAATVMTCLAKRPDMRPTAAELAERLAASADASGALSAGDIIRRAMEPAPEATSLAPTQAAR